MIRKSLNRAAFAMVILLAVWPAAHAQNEPKSEQKDQPKNELGLLLGGIKPPELSITGPNGGVVNFGTGLTFQATYARRLTSGKGAAAIYFEVPFLATPKVDLAGSDPAVPSEYASLFITPGLRLKFKPNSGLSPWLAVGGGYARFKESATRQDGDPNTGRIGANKGAIQFGGGVDMHTPFKIVFPLNLRFELRDIYSGKPNYNVDVGSGYQHNLLYSGGLVLSF